MTAGSLIDTAVSPSQLFRKNWQLYPASINEANGIFSVILSAFQKLTKGTICSANGARTNPSMSFLC